MELFNPDASWTPVLNEISFVEYQSPEFGK